jgi:ABC-2 type transport system ATP-binding protein
MSSTPVIETKNLTRVYNHDIVAVDKLNLSINEGDIFGFLGPNGAGKTTTILMLLGLTQPNSGVARVYGFNCTREPLKVKRVTGYVPERLGFYDDLSAYYNLAYTARLNGLSDEEVRKRVPESLKEVGLTEAADRNVGQFSAGMRQRLGIADILVKEPKVAIMDEPTSGIDPKGINQLLDLVATVVKERGMTVIMCSHQLAQVQRICNRVGIMQKGKMVVEGDLNELGAQLMGGGKYRIEVKLSGVTPEVIESINRVNGVLQVERQGEALYITCNEDLRPQVAKAIVDSGGLLVQMSVQSYALEDIYMKYFSEGQ